LCAPTSVLNYWKQADWMLTSNKGWIYFSNPSLKVVTDQDIRDDAIFSSISNSISSYPLSELGDKMEVFLMQLFVGTGLPSFNLVINHKHCIASYVSQQVQDKNFHSLAPNTRMILQELLSFLAKLRHSESKAPSLLELSVEAPCSCPYPRESNSRCCRCLDVVLCTMLKFFRDCSLMIYRRTILSRVREVSYHSQNQNAKISREFFRRCLVGSIQHNTICLIFPFLGRTT
jgi:hypothetical protein